MTNRLDVELALRGLVRSRERASRLIRAGEVHVDGRCVVRPSVKVDETAVLDVRDSEYVSRAAFKLAGALESFAAAGWPVTTDGARCLDLGASTGGFTDVLLKRGALHVDAVDVGHGQLVDELRADDRVSSHEGTNVRDLRAGAFGDLDVVVGDLSFISLRLVVPVVAALVNSQTDILLLVKPQFEVGRERLGSSGVVKSLDQRAEAIETVAREAMRSGLSSIGLVPSGLPGPNGNREFVLRLRKTESSPQSVPADAIRDVVHLDLGSHGTDPVHAWMSVTDGRTETR